MNCYPFIETEKAQRYNFRRGCELLKVSRAAYCIARQDQSSKRTRDDAMLTTEINTVHDGLEGPGTARCASTRVNAQLCRQGGGIPASGSPG